jgi:TonB family protein
MARRAALAWLAAGAWLAAAATASGQRNDDPGGPRFPVGAWAMLYNRDEMEREIATRYPPALRDAAVAEQVLLRFKVLGNGRVDSTSIAVVRTRNAAFAEPAMAVARRLRFSPATALGRAVPIWAEFPVYFSRPGVPGADGVTQGSVDQEANLRNREEVAREIRLRYPPGLRDAGIAGSVLLRFKVTGDGTVDSASISMRQATDTALVEPAMLVVRRMAFTPAVAAGRPVQTWVTAPVHFVPEGTRESPPDEGTYALSEVEVRPQFRYRAETARQIEARYPRALLNARVTGDVHLTFRILANGTVDRESIRVEMATNPAFVEPATIVTRGMRFTPAMLGGRPVNVWATVPIHFGIVDPPPAGSDSTRARAPTPP